MGGWQISAGPMAGRLPTETKTPGPAYIVPPRESSSARQVVVALVFIESVIE